MWYRYYNHKWDNSLYEGLISPRTISYFDEASVTSGRMDTQKPNHTTIIYNRKVEAHKNAFICRYRLHIKTADGAEFDDPVPGLAYYRKINNRWVMTSDEPLPRED